MSHTVKRRARDQDATVVQQQQRQDDEMLVVDNSSEWNKPDEVADMRKTLKSLIAVLERTGDTTRAARLRSRLNR